MVAPPPAPRAGLAPLPAGQHPALTRTPCRPKPIRPPPTSPRAPPQKPRAAAVMSSALLNNAWVDSYLDALVGRRPQAGGGRAGRQGGWGGGAAPDTPLRCAAKACFEGAARLRPMTRGLLAERPRPARIALLPLRPRPLPTLPSLPPPPPPRLPQPFTPAHRPLPSPPFRPRLRHSQPLAPPPSSCPRASPPRPHAERPRSSPARRPRSTPSPTSRRATICSRSWHWMKVGRGEALRGGTGRP
jgi:hypothetical protein